MFPIFLTQQKPKLSLLFIIIQETSPFCHNNNNFFEEFLFNKQQIKYIKNRRKL